jgi:nucleoside transporter
MGDLQAVSLPWSLRARLSGMMFLQYAIWGAWAPVLGLYLKAPGPMGFSGTQVSLIYMTWAIATIISPLVAGQIADRWFATQHFLALVHGLGGGLMFLMAGAELGNFWLFFALMSAYQLLCAPTMGLTSSLAFHHLTQGEKQFGSVRLWGTIGWIVIGLVFGEWLKDWDTLRRLLGLAVEPVSTDLVRVGQCLHWAGVLSLVCAVYCLTLPNTPPSRQASNPFAFLAALRLLGERSFAVLFFVSIIVATELQFYFVFGANFFREALGFDQGTAGQLLTIGQIVEVATLAALPWFVGRFGIKWTILLGILAWTARYGIFALGQPWWLVVASQGLHGLAYGFFFVGGQIYTDRVAGKDIKASAQSLMLLATLGVGKLISSLVAGPVVDAFSELVGGQTVTNWHYVFLVPAAVTLAGAFLFSLTFREKRREEVAPTAVAARPQAEPELVR